MKTINKLITNYLIDNGTGKSYFLDVEDDIFEKGETIDLVNTLIKFAKLGYKIDFNLFKKLFHISGVGNETNVTINKAVISRLDVLNDNLDKMLGSNVNHNILVQYDHNISSLNCIFGGFTMDSKEYSKNIGLLELSKDLDYLIDYADIDLNITNNEENIYTILNSFYNTFYANVSVYNTLEIITKNELYNKLIDIISVNNNLDLKTYSFIKALVLDEDNEYKDILYNNVNDIKMKNILALFIADTINKNKEVYFAKNGVDILRACSILSGYNADLPNKLIFKSFGNKMRLRIAKELNSVLTHQDLKQYPHLFKVLFKLLHVGSRKYNKLKNLQDMAYLLRNNELLIENKNTKLHNAVHGKITNLNKDIILNTLLDNPSIFIRGLDNIIRKNEDFINDILVCFNSIEAKYLNVKLLLQLYNHFSNRNVDIENRQFKIGKVGQAQYHKTDKHLERLDTNILNQVKESILKNIQRCYKYDNRYNQISFIDESIIDFKLPMDVKDIKSNKILTRGSKLSLVEKLNIREPIMRLFLHWDSHDDMDLSVVFLDKDFKIVSRCAYYELKSNYYEHSGDVRNGIGGASEFVDVYLDKLPKDICYVLTYVNLFNGSNIDSINDLFYGYMIRSANDKGFIYEPTKVENIFNMQGDITQTIAFIYDINEKNIIGANLNENGGYFRNADTLDLTNVCNLIINSNSLSLYDTISLCTENILYDDSGLFNYMYDIIMTLSKTYMDSDIILIENENIDKIFDIDKLKIIHSIFGLKNSNIIINMNKITKSYVEISYTNGDNIIKMSFYSSDFKYDISTINKQLM